MSLGRVSIPSMSKKQKINTNISMECELVREDDVLPQILWITYFLEPQGYNIDDNINALVNGVVDGKGENTTRMKNDVSTIETTDNEKQSKIPPPLMMKTMMAVVIIMAINRVMRKPTKEYAIGTTPKNENAVEINTITATEVRTKQKKNKNEN